MSEILVTLVGNVATQPELKQTSAGVPVARFRVATTERRFDRAGDRWTDGHTSFFTVWAWRSLGENVAGSVGIGEPVIVQGRLRVHDREDKGQNYLTANVDAVTVGHDLNRGTSAFRRVLKPRTEWADRAPGGSSDAPEPSESSPSASSPDAERRADPSRSTGAATATPRDPALVPS